MALTPGDGSAGLARNSRAAIQIAVSTPLYQAIQQIAQQRDSSVAGIFRRALEVWVEAQDDLPAEAVETVRTFSQQARPHSWARARKNGADAPAAPAASTTSTKAEG